MRRATNTKQLRQHDDDDDDDDEVVDDEREREERAFHRLVYHMCRSKLLYAIVIDILSCHGGDECSIE